MVIIVKDKTINTELVADVWDIERDKKHFLNSQAGFVVLYKNGNSELFYEDIDYESTSRDIYNIKMKWYEIRVKIRTEINKQNSTKDVFRQQIIDAHLAGQLTTDSDDDTKQFFADQYYRDTFGGDK